MVNEYCYKYKKVLISAALQNFDVQVFSFKAWSNKQNPCYECIFPRFSQKNIFNCDQMGIISPVAGFGGIMQAITLIDIILGCKNSVYKELIIFDSFSRILKKKLRSVKISSAKFVQIKLSVSLIFIKSGGFLPRK